MVDAALTNGGLEGATAPAANRRALVALNVATPRAVRGVSRPAAFLAHLIAVKENHPQTRERRRVEPTEAVNAYRAAMAPASSRP